MVESPGKVEKEAGMACVAHDISVIVCAYTQDRLPDLIAALESVQRQTLPAREIIVVIDHNPDLWEKVQAQVANVMVVENTEMRGLSGARNSGIAAAKGQLLAFLDDDAVAAPDWLCLLNEGFQDAHVLGVGGAVEPHWVDGDPTWLPEEFYWVVGCSYRGMPRTSTTIRNPIGANMAFRREVFDTVAGFRSEIGRIGRLPLGCEETELCIRARQRWPDRVFLYQPQARVSHSVPRSRTRWHYFRTRCYAEGRSKAMVAHYVGIKDGLSSESTYTLKTLPQGVLRNLAAALLQHDLAGLKRAGAIVIGLAVTTAGYLVGSAASKMAREHTTAPGGVPYKNVHEHMHVGTHP